MFDLSLTGQLTLKARQKKKKFINSKLHKIHNGLVVNHARTVINHETKKERNSLFSFVFSRKT